MTPCKKKLDAMSLGELSKMLAYYDIYDTSKKSGEDTRPSGPQMKEYLRNRLVEMDKTIPKPVERTPDVILFDLQALMQIKGYGLNMLQRLENELYPYLHNGNRAMRRKPAEYAREVVLELLTEGFVIQDLPSPLILELFEGYYKPDISKVVRGRGIDWVIYQKKVEVV